MELAKDRVVDQKIVRSHVVVLRNTTANLAEAKVAEAAHQDAASSAFCVKAAEGGGCDLALYLGSTPFADLSITDRFFLLTRTEARRKCLLPGDVKSVEPLRDSHGGVQWQLQLTEHQKRRCRFLVCASAADPKTVALLPLSWFETRFDNHMIYIGGDRWYFSTQHDPAFPPQWAPCLLPYSRLGEALGNLRRFALGEEPHWRVLNISALITLANEIRVNPHTGVHYDESPSSLNLGVSDPSVLEPTFAPWQKAIKQIEFLRKGFIEMESFYRVELILNAPLFGDCKLVNVGNDQEQFIECKSGSCQFEYDAEGRPCVLRHYQSRLGFSDVQIFTWKCQWDFLYTVAESSGISRPRHIAAFIPRDEIPQSWWNAPLEDDQAIETSHYSLSWTVDEDRSFRDFVIEDLEDTSHLVRRIIDIVEEHGSAQGPVPMAPIASKTLEEVHDVDERKQLAKDDASLQPLPTPRGSTYQNIAAQALMQVCRKYGNGTVIDVGRHNKRTWHLLVRHIWTQPDKDEYDQNGHIPRHVGNFDMMALVIPILFLRLTGPLFKHARTVSNTEQTGVFWKDRPPCVMICDMSPQSSLDLPHARFIFYSEQIGSSEDFARRKIFQLRHGTLEDYYTDEADLIGKIQEPLSKPSQRIGHGSIDPGAYRCFLRDVLQAGVSGVASTDPRIAKGKAAEYLQRESQPA